MKVFPDRLTQALQDSLPSIGLVAGPEALLVEESMDIIRARAKDAGVSERVVLEADARFDWAQLTTATETGSLFATQRLVEVHLPTGKPGKEGGAAIRDWLAESRDDILMIKCNAWELASEKSVWFKALEQAGIFVPCWLVKPHQLPKWIAQRLNQHGLRIDQSGAQFLAERLEGNLLAAAQEVERLSLLYANGHALTLAELKDLVADSARYDAFRLTELVLNGQTGAGLRCIRGLVETETPMPMVVSALARELQVLGAYIALRKTQRPEACFQALRVWPSRQGPLDAAAKRLSSKHISEALAELSALDRMSKSNAAHGFWVRLERLCVALSSEHPQDDWARLVNQHVA
jgi:DNA polymerase-3 subunit delta